MEQSSWNGLVPPPPPPDTTWYPTQPSPAVPQYSWLEVANTQVAYTDPTDVNISPTDDFMNDMVNMGESSNPGVGGIAFDEDLGFDFDAYINQAGIGEIMGLIE